jgi:YVTN family beta-propeller protein
MPSAIAVDPTSNKIYVANFRDNTVSVINGTTETKEPNDITVGDSPSSIAVNTAVSMIYVTNFVSDTISIIDARTNRYQVGVTFNADSGYIQCNRMVIPTNIQVFIDFGSACQARPNEGFFPTFWSESLGANSSRNLNSSGKPDLLSSLLGALLLTSTVEEVPFGATSYGNFVAHFKELPPPVGNDVLLNQYNSLVLAILTGLLVPHFIPWIKKRRSQHILKQYVKKCLP